MALLDKKGGAGDWRWTGKGKSKQKDGIDGKEGVAGDLGWT